MSGGWVFLGLIASAFNPLVQGAPLAQNRCKKNAIHVSSVLVGTFLFRPQVSEKMRGKEEVGATHQSRVFDKKNGEETACDGSCFLPGSGDLAVRQHCAIKAKGH
ncbi:hypothetical protein [Acanthopleuribacter pedis]|uniref:Uncharacterized protein n=1 Tax=Acanthopleuribacter pedis TaxID=442870 RepID=A0A8J7Q9Y2_9BACT|nr:hypothetical protein [Acanthopleuribacter pedis]MBO1320535.1 hypothetical protein [Acanthopleuribacter pedis]